MIEVLLIVVIGMLWFLLRPKRDWFIVERRCCTDKQLCSTAFSFTAEIFGFDKTTLSAHGLTIDNNSINIAYKSKSLASAIVATLLGVRKSIRMVHKKGGQISIEQTIFDNVDAAIMHLERLKELLPYGDHYEELYLWRVVSRSRRKAVTLPPEHYSDKDKDGKLLMRVGKQAPK